MNLKSRNLSLSCRHVFTATLAAGIFLAVVSPSNAQWTQWGGPKQEWKSDSKGLAAEWPAEGPKELWHRELGEGYSSVLVDRGTLYTMFRRGEQEVVTALDAENGSTRWEYSYEAPPAQGHMDQFGRGPRSTPLLDQGRLYTAGVAGKMHCLDAATGKSIWSHDLWNEFKGSFLIHGYSSSPIAYGDMIVMLVGGEGNAMMAFKKSDGTVAWKRHDFENSYSTPKLVQIDGKDQMLCFMGTELVGIDPKNGDLLWQVPHENQWKQNIVMPIVGPDNTVFLSAAEAGSKAVQLVKNGDKYDVKELWSLRKMQLYHSTAVLVGDFVYGSSGTGMGGGCFFSAVNLKTGELAWREKGLGKATCIYADGKFIILDEDGNLALATATPEKFTVHSKIPLLGKVSWTVPTLAGTHLYVRDKEKLVALDLS